LNVQTGPIVVVVVVVVKFSLLINPEQSEDASPIISIVAAEDADTVFN
jgi:hypothetical protein